MKFKLVNKSKILNNIIRFFLLLILPITSVLADDRNNPAFIKESIGLEDNIDNKLEENFPEHDTEDLSYTEEKEEKTTANQPSYDQFFLMDLKLEGNKLYTEQDLKPLYKDYLDKYITIHDLYDIRAMIKEKYKSNGYLLTEVIVPPQKLNKYGEIPKIIIVESYFSETEYLDQNNAAINYYAEQIKKSIPLYIHDMQDNMLFMNRVPGIQAQASIAAADHTPGSSKLIIDAKEKKFVTNITANNYASKNLGPLQTTAMFSVNNVYAINTLNFSTAFTPKDVNNMNYFALTYKQLLYWLNNIEISLGYESSNTRPQHTELKAIELHNKNTKYYATLTYPINLTKDYAHILNIGIYDTDNISKNIAGIAYQDKYRAVHLTQNIRINDKFNGTNLIENKITWGYENGDASKGTITSRSDKQHQPLTGSFIKLQTSIDRETYLNKNIDILTAAKMQLALRSIFSNEQLNYGGQSYGGAYGNAGLVGDNGILLKIETRYNKYLPEKYPLNKIQAYFNIDGGYLGNYAYDLPSSYAVSLSTGLRAYSFNGLSIKFSIAKAANKELTEEKNSELQYRFSFEKSF